MQDLNLPSLTDFLGFDPTPLLWVAGGVAAAFTLAVLLLLPIALIPGRVGDHARAALKQILGLFHHALDAISRRHRGGRR